MRFGHQPSPARQKPYIGVTALLQYTHAMAPGSKSAQLQALTTTPNRQLGEFDGLLPATDEVGISTTTAAYSASMKTGVRPPSGPCRQTVLEKRAWRFSLCFAALVPSTLEDESQRAPARHAGAPNRIG